MRSISPSARVYGLVLLALLPRPAAAAWPGDPTANMPLCLATGTQRYPEAARDGGGGIIVAWDDQRGGPRDIYVQRVDATGTARWTTNGVAICSAANEQYEPKIVADGSGGAIVTWSDLRNGVAFDIYAQRVDSAGAPKWTANGVAIGAATGWQSHPAIVSDGSGGAIIAWDDERSGAARIYAQRVNAAGSPQWTTNGVLLTNSVSGQARPVIVSDGAGGAIVAWEDYRNGEVDVFAQRIRANGTLDPAWPAAGRAVALGWGDQDHLAMAADGSGGALIAWQQWNGGTRDIYVHHVLSTGALDAAWPAGGRLMIPGFDFYDQSSPAIAADGAGGAIVSWEDGRNSSRDIYAHRVLASGALDPSWPTTGRGLCLADGTQWFPRMVSDGAGGAIVTWWDARNDDGDVYAQRVLASGDVDSAWPVDGAAISTAGLLQLVPVIVSDGAGGAVIAWEDRRSGAGEYGDDGDIYAQRVKANGQIGEGTVSVADRTGVALVLESPRPNPTRAGDLIVRFTLPSAAAAALEVFDVAGRRVFTRQVGSLGAGHHAVDLASAWRPRAGIYFVRLQQVQEARVRKLVVLEE